MAALVVGTLTMANANAADPVPTADVLTSAAASDLASTLATELKGDAAGAYYDAKTKQLVVNVLDASAAEEVQQAGAKAKVVRHSLAQLTSAKDDLGESAVPGTSRAVDPVTNKVVVTADSTVKAADLAKLREEVEAQGGRAVLKKTSGEFKPFIAGGDAIFSSGSRCSLGFNVVKDGEPHFLTAGHCGTAGSSWSASSGGSPIGRMEAGTFPGADHALVKYTSSTDHPSEVNLYNGRTQQITDARDATVGEQVQRSGSTTQLHGGSVQALDVSVTYPQGTVNGLIQTNVCAEPGDSGGALFAGSSALGLTSGGSGDCSSGGQTFFQPVTDALAEYGAQIG
ncbi:S1 family peptidase [Streptomyces sp. 549]|uniref:S1 family peptidase n=1 Tax=Streptomyces sp. 549 TaxID=3049076 RepID=UPI0024C3564F|nr:S1 family peptidase [Streptomyces sp. 549]MDK1475667.1 S1 family peptidase [Streptomyces sp. 549]